jgi:hypothetical protein
MFSIDELPFSLKDMILLITGTLLTVPISYFFYRKGLNTPQACYSGSVKLLIEKPKIDGLEVLFSKEPISRFSRVRYIFWNCGRRAIEHTDIPSMAPIHIQLGELANARYLGHQLVFMSRTENAITLRISELKLIVEFEFLNPMDGAIVDLYVENDLEASKLKIPPLTGIIKGTPVGLIDSPLSIAFTNQRFFIACWLILISGPLSLFEPLYYVFSAPIGYGHKIFLLATSALRSLVLSLWARLWSERD